MFFDVVGKELWLPWLNAMATKGLLKIYNDKSGNWQSLPCHQDIYEYSPEKNA